MKYIVYSNYSICDTGLWWQDLASDLNTPKDIVCSAKEESEPTVFSVRVLILFCILRSFKDILDRTQLRCGI